MRFSLLLRMAGRVGLVVALSPGFTACGARTLLSERTTDTARDAGPDAPPEAAPGALDAGSPSPSSEDAGEHEAPLADAATPPEGDAALPNPFVVGDDWTGTYVCAQGVTNLTLHVLAVSGDAIDDAVFDFDWTSGSVTGSYHLSGTYDPTTDHARFAPGAWIAQPAGWFSVGMDGTVDPTTPVYAGHITDSSCAAFSVTRVAR